MHRMIRENGSGNPTRIGGWSLKELVRAFREEYCPRQPDLQYYTSNNVIPALRERWVEALALRCDMHDNPIGSAERVEARLYAFTRMKLSDWESTSRLCSRGAAVAVSGEESAAGGGFAEDAESAAGSRVNEYGSIRRRLRRRIRHRWGTTSDTLVSSSPRKFKLQTGEENHNF